MRAPKNLTKLAKKIYRKITSEWELDPSADLLLVTALEAWDEYQAARKQLQAEGYTVKNPKTGLVRKHPSVEILKISRAQFLMAWRSLNLDIAPPEG